MSAPLKRKEGKLKQATNRFSLILTTSHNEDIPPANSHCFEKPEKSGFLLRLTGKNLVSGGSWKKRYCLLDGAALYYYESKDSRGSEKSAGSVKLNQYTKCWAGEFTEYKKVTNVFIISGKQPRDIHYFAAETLTEMNDWIQKVQRVINKSKLSNSPTRCEKTPTQQRNTPPIVDEGSLSDSQNIERLYGRGPMGLYNGVSCSHERLCQSTADLVYQYSSSDDSLNNYSIASESRKRWNLSMNKGSSNLGPTPFHKETGSEICDLDIIHESPPNSCANILCEEFTPSKFRASLKSTPPCLKKINSSCRQKGFLTRGHSCEEKSSIPVNYPHPDLLTGRSVAPIRPTNSIGNLSFEMRLLDNQYKVLGVGGVESNRTLCASSTAESDSTYQGDVIPTVEGQKMLNFLTSTLKDLTNRVQILVGTVKQVDKDITLAKRDVGSVQENLAKVVHKVQSVEKKTAKMTSSLIPLFGSLKEVQDMSNKARKMLEEAESAKREYCELRDLYKELIKRETSDSMSNTSQGVPDSTLPTIPTSSCLSSREGKGHLPFSAYHSLSSRCGTGLYGSMFQKDLLSAGQFSQDNGCPPDSSSQEPTKCDSESSTGGSEVPELCALQTNGE